MHVICVFIDGLLKVTCVLYIHTKLFLKIFIKKIWFNNIIIIYYLTNGSNFIFMEIWFYI